MNKSRCSCGAFLSPGRSCRRCGNTAFNQQYQGLDYLNCMSDYTQYQDFQFVGAPIPDMPDVPPGEPIDWNIQMPDMGKIGRIAGAVGTGLIDNAVPGFGMAVDIAKIIADTNGGEHD
jgi:hypothetical protein